DKDWEKAVNNGQFPLSLKERGIAWQPSGPSPQTRAAAVSGPFTTIRRKRRRESSPGGKAKQSRQRSKSPKAVLQPSAQTKEPSPVPTQSPASSPPYNSQDVEGSDSGNFDDESDLAQEVKSVPAQDDASDTDQDDASEAAQENASDEGEGF
ncbi:MAG: hypothetical protein M1829_002922, partial [Trizodia sp. TS-e1964]